MQHLLGLKNISIKVIETKVIKPNVMKKVLFQNKNESNNQKRKNPQHCDFETKLLQILNF